MAGIVKKCKICLCYLLLKFSRYLDEMFKLKVAVHTAFLEQVVSSFFQQCKAQRMQLLPRIHLQETSVSVVRAL